EQAKARVARDVEESQLRWPLTAFGETKKIYQWAEDDIRGKGVDGPLIYKRLSAGWEPRKAIELDADGPEAEKYGRQVAEAKEAKKKAELDKRRKLADEKERLENPTVFGETKPLTAWLRDARCKVYCDRFVARLRAGWPPEAALTTR